MPSHKGVPGSVTLIEGTNIGVLFDGTKAVHKWYAPKELQKIVTKAIVDSGALATGGKLAPAQNGGKPKPKVVDKCACGKSADQTTKCEKSAADCSMKKAAKAAEEAAQKDSEGLAAFIPIAKAIDEEQTVSGVVLKPETTDAQGDIYSADVIREAAFNFLANYNKDTKLGHQHKDFKNWRGRFALVESYVAPHDFVLGDTIVTTGSWVMTVKVLDSKIWAMVKAGKITGFSIGGKARVQKLVDD